MKARIRAIQRVNDPTTNADEVLTGAKILLWALLIYSGMLGALNYFKNFGLSFPYWLAVFMSLVLAFAIEWGKNRCATWAIRLPFFQGFKFIFSTPANTFIFLALLAVAIATFAMSVINSTRGAEQLSLMLSRERNASPFQPDTKDLDTQITDAQKSIDENRGIKWKGTVTYQAQKAIQSQTKSLETLQRVRQDRLNQQRADWEKQQSIQEDQGNHAAGIVLASGGWVELIQFLLIILRVACEKNLDGRQAPTLQGEEKREIGFRSNSAYAAEAPAGPTGGTPSPYRYIGFNRDQSTGNVRSAVPENPVSQLPPPVSQENEPAAGFSAEEILKYYLTELRREPSNFSNKWAANETVAGRIHHKLNRAAGAIFKMTAVDYRIAKEFSDYLSQKIEPILNEKGFPYSGFLEIRHMLVDRAVRPEEAGSHDA